MKEDKQRPFSELNRKHRVDHQLWQTSTQLDNPLSLGDGSTVSSVGCHGAASSDPVAEAEALRAAGRAGPAEFVSVLVLDEASGPDRRRPPECDCDLL